MEAMGRMEEGVFIWPDGRKQDGHQAVLEHLVGHKLDYPEPRFTSYVVMRSEAYAWQPLEDVGGVSVRHLGYFNESGPNLKVVHMEAGATLPANMVPWQQVRVLITGELAYEEQRYSACTAMYLPANTAYGKLSATQDSELFVVQMATDAGEAPAFCRL
jgi:hypothetical protein